LAAWQALVSSAVAVPRAEAARCAARVWAEPAGGGTDDEPDAADHRQPEVRDDLVPVGAAERGHDQAGEPAERREQGHLQVAEALEGQREQGRDHQDRAHHAQPGRLRPGRPPGGAGPMRDLREARALLISGIGPV
jgi:hypothetical protein